MGFGLLRAGKFWFLYVYCFNWILITASYYVQLYVIYRSDSSIFGPVYILFVYTAHQIIARTIVLR